MTDQSPVITNVLATRYASPELAQLWSAEGKIVLERQLWIAVLTAQAQLGMDVPDGVIADYEAVVDQVDLASIDARERVTRHDVKARIEEFSELAGHEYIHAGMTSRDLTENVEQLQLKRSMELLADRAVASLARLGSLAAEHSATVMAGRSHNVAAQATTLGKRFASAAEELLVAHDRLRDLIDRYPVRGLKGPVGTQARSVVSSTLSSRTPLPLLLFARRTVCSPALRATSIALAGLPPEKCTHCQEPGALPAAVCTLTGHCLSTWSQ